MRLIIVFFAFICSSFLAAQVPGLMPYQAVARDASGQILSNTATTARFKLHELTASGAVIWSEDQAVLTNTNGLFTAQLGAINSLQNINWAQDGVYLQVEVLVGGTYIDQGTKQLLSVPYAKVAGSIKLNVSATGDTLVIGNGEPLIIPGLSAANPPPVSGLPHTCGLPGVHNEAVIYGTVTDIDGNVYKTITINGREWMAENLNVGRFRNGDQVFITAENDLWAGTILTPLSCYYQNEIANACPYGRIYNFYAVTDSRGLCPTGWHVPDNYEWSLIDDALGGSSVSGGNMKTEGTVEAGNGLWYAPNTGATNLSGFSAVPGGYRSQYGGFTQKGYGAYYWSGQSAGSNDGWFHQFLYNSSGPSGNIFDGRFGTSVRCIRDL
jgi:uncharacterized protein (TIGR02145 family)